MKNILPFTYILALALATEVSAANEASEKAKHKIGVYGWLPVIDADSTVDGGTAPIDFSAKDTLDNLDGAFSGRYEYLSPDNIGFYTEFQWVSLKVDDDVGPLSIDADIEQITVDLGAFYRLDLRDGAYFDTMLGFVTSTLNKKLMLSPRARYRLKT